MTLTIPGLEDDGARASVEREAETDHVNREDLPTPRGMIRSSIEHGLAKYLRVHTHPVTGLRGISLWRPGMLEPVVSLEFEDRPFRVLDVCAGYGAWASEFARFWVHGLGLPREWLHITGIEICEARRDDLDKWCDDWALDDYVQAIKYGAIIGGLKHSTWDLVIGNPHFSALTHANPEESMPAVLLDHAPAVFLLHTLNCFVRNDIRRRVWRAYTPAVQWAVPGTVSFDGTSSVASDCYAVSLWLRDHDGTCAGPHLLDVEPEDFNREQGILTKDGKPYKCWRWSVGFDGDQRYGIPPGSEMPSVCKGCGGVGEKLRRTCGVAKLAGCQQCQGTRLDPNGDLPAAPGWTP